MSLSDKIRGLTQLCAGGVHIFLNMKIRDTNSDILYVCVCVFFVENRAKLKKKKSCTGDATRRSLLLASFFFDVFLDGLHLTTLFGSAHPRDGFSVFT